MRKTSMKKAPPKKPKPELKWQTGKYDRHAQFSYFLPNQFLLLCKLMDVTPEDVVRDFTDNLSCGSWKREGRDKIKKHLIDYFIEHGYGQHYYTENEIREIFTEMDALGLLFPKEGKSKLIDKYANWRDKHYKYWFKKWFSKARRKIQN